MTEGRQLPPDSAEELLEEAPCGYLSTLPDGTIVRVNRTFERWTGRDREELLGGVRFQELLSPGGRIFHETHYAPMLALHGSVREIAVEVLRADGSRLPALVNAVQVPGEDGRPALIRTVVFDATDRRRYEETLLADRRHEQGVAQQLQRSLLAGDLPRAEGLELGVVYRPGVQGLEVGGDWYDAFWVEEGRTVALVVGDVVGRGVEAATTMGQLRSALRALAPTAGEPARVLEALDRFSRRHDVGQVATLFLGVLDLETRRIRHSSAGHPPALLVAPPDEPLYVWDGRSVPLDTHAGTEDKRAGGELTLPPGGSLLLYTDGLVERRRRSMTEGMDRLAEAVGNRGTLAADELASTVVRELDDGERDDDVCVLVARLL